MQYCFASVYYDVEYYLDLMAVLQQIIHSLQYFCTQIFLWKTCWYQKFHCKNYTRVEVFSNLCFPVKGQNLRFCPCTENTGQIKPTYLHILRSVYKKLLANLFFLLTFFFYKLDLISRINLLNQSDFRHLIRIQSNI